MAGQLLNTGNSAVIGRQGYRILQDVTVRPARKAPTVPVEGRVHRAWDWVDALGKPKAFARALASYEAAKVATFEPSPELRALGVPSLEAEARKTWKKRHATAERAALYACAVALHESADELFDRARAMLADAVKAKDEATLSAVTAAVAAMRSAAMVPWVWHTTDKISARPLDAWAAEAWLARPDEHHADGRPKLTARTFLDGTYGAGIYTADEIVENLTATVARVVEADEVDRRAVGHRRIGL